MKRHLLLCLILFLCVPVFSQGRHQLRRNGRVLAYGLNFNPEQPEEQMPEALREMLRGYKMQSQRYSNRLPGRHIAPLLNSVRKQTEPFNHSCPFYVNDQGVVSEERTIAGCVATSIEQVINYYRYPNELQAPLIGWETPHYSLPDVPAGTPIDWENILDDYRFGYTEAQAQAVSDLMFYCGMACHMQYGLSSSSANMGAAFEPLCNAFGYGTVVYLSRALYSSTTWNAMLRNELENGRPICYTGHNMAMGGHAFNIDGVDAEGYYHINWSYNGQYDGWFDLDYLNPFEPFYDNTNLGQSEGFYSNQTALFLHPEDLDIDVSDSLRMKDAFEGVVVDKITFRRQPDIHEYVVADLSMTNTTDHHLCFTFEVFTYLPTDEDIFKQADYVALSAVNLAPGEHRTWPVYCRFAKDGERILGFSADDETIPFTQNVNVQKGTTPKLEFGPVSYELLQFDDDLTAHFSIDVTNVAASGYAGNLITYCLFPEDSEEDLRHWEVLSLPAGKTHRASIRFHHLEDGHTYTLRIRQPWTVREEFTFIVKSEDAVDAISAPVAEPSHADGRMYDLTGRPVGSKRGLVIKDGRKILIH